VEHSPGAVLLLDRADGWRRLGRAVAALLYGPDGY
jgi:hypothetical protein